MPNRFDDADRLVAHPAAFGGGGKIVVRVKVGAADSGVGDADQGFGGLLDGEIGDSTIQTSPDFYISVAFKVFLQSRAQW